MAAEERNIGNKSPLYKGTPGVTLVTSTQVLSKDRLISECDVFGNESVEVFSSVSFSPSMKNLVGLIFEKFRDPKNPVENSFFEIFLSNPLDHNNKTHIGSIDLSNEPEDRLFKVFLISGIKDPATDTPLFPKGISLYSDSIIYVGSRKGMREDDQWKVTIMFDDYSPFLESPDR